MRRRIGEIILFIVLLALFLALFVAACDSLVRAWK